MSAPRAYVTPDDIFFKSLPAAEFAALCESEGPRVTAEIERAMAETSKLFGGPPPAMLPMPRWL